jgi:hypothetical protein
MKRTKMLLAVWALLITVCLFVIDNHAKADGVVNTIVQATDGSGIAVNVQQKDISQTTQDIANSVGDYTSLARGRSGQQRRRFRDGHLSGQRSAGFVADEILGAIISSGL